MSNGLTPETYDDVFAQLERAQARYVVIGGVAVVLHGYARPIADLDIAVDPAPDEARRAFNALCARGFAASIPLPLSAITIMRMYDRSGREVDLFVRYLIPFAELWSGSELLKVHDRSVRVISREHLIREKRVNDLPHNRLDVDGLLASAKPSDPSTDTNSDTPEQPDSE